MLPPKRILFPVDYSEPGSALAPYVKDILDHFSGELTLLHAYGPVGHAYQELALADPRLPEQLREREERRLRAFALETFPGRQVETVVVNAEPGDAIRDLVADRGADLAMLSTHGYGPLRRLLLGSTAAKALHDLDCAVWTANGLVTSRSQPVIPYRSILCAVDQSESAEVAARAAHRIAETYHARLTLMHVVETPPASIEIDFEPMRKTLCDEADFRLRELKTKLEIDGPHAVLDGGVAEATRDEAVRREADLIVIGRGRIQGLISRLWAHSYAIARDAPCPVLSV